MPAPMIVRPRGKHTASIIFAHGLGDSAQGWYPLARALSEKPQFAHVKWVLPTAPVAPVTANGGYRMTSWCVPPFLLSVVYARVRAELTPCARDRFDIQQIDPRAGILAEDDAGMLSSVRTLAALISDEVDAGIPSDRVLVGGFSQGAVISYLTALTSERRLAGVAALSGFLGMAGKVKAARRRFRLAAQVCRKSTLTSGRCARR